MDNNRQFQQNMVMGSGLARYRSAPTSYFATLLNSAGAGGPGLIGNDELDNLFYPRDSSPDTQKILSGFMGASEPVQESCSFKLDSKPPLDSPLVPPRMNESAVSRPQQQSYDYSSSVTRMTAYQTQNTDTATAAMQDSYSRLIETMNSNSNLTAPLMKIEGGGGGGYGVSSTLIRHSSSPAGFFANRIIKNEFSGQMENSSQTDNVIKDSRYNVVPGCYPASSWDDSVILSDDFLNGLPNDDQRNEKGNRSADILSHQLSIPKGSTDLSAIEKLMQDSVPYKIRAKRGLATHPRSIAERVRRTKISERMRKLQELVPNMEKQTNTADMLDLAVDYIKDLQIQVKRLREDRGQCSCSGKRL